jgi:hypothetical protein
MTEKKRIAQAVNSMGSRVGPRSYIVKRGLGSPHLFWSPIEQIYVAFVNQFWKAPLLYKIRVGDSGSYGYNVRIPKVGMRRLRSETNVCSLRPRRIDLDVQVVVTPEELEEGCDLAIDIAKCWVLGGKMEGVESPFTLWLPYCERAPYYSVAWSTKAATAYRGETDAGQSSVRTEAE